MTKEQRDARRASIARVRPHEVEHRCTHYEELAYLDALDAMEAEIERLKSMFPVETSGELLIRELQAEIERLKAAARKLLAAEALSEEEGRAMEALEEMCREQERASRNH